MLWACALSLGCWREVMRGGEYAGLGVYALEVYGLFEVRFFSIFFYAGFSLSLSVYSRVV